MKTLLILTLFLSIISCSKNIDPRIGELYKKVEIEMKKKDYTKAESHLQEILRIAPNYSNAYMLLADVYEFQTDKSKAQECYQKVISINEKLKHKKIHNHYDLFNAHFRLQNYEKAEAVLIEAKAQFPEDAFLKDYKRMLETYKEKTTNQP